MIKLPVLDDQNYIDIVEAAKRRIPVIFPEWTDFNEHDPGITLIELFAWLKEMQQYTLDRMPDNVRQAMLLLAGTKPYEPSPAKAKLLFTESVPEKLSVGSSAFSADGAEFMLTEPFERQPFSIEKVIMNSADGFVDITEISSEQGTTFYPFGADLDCRNRSLYLKLSSAADKLTFDIFTQDKCDVPRNPCGDDISALRSIVWEYSTANGFKRCAVEKDETFGLSFSGKITLCTDDDFAATLADVPSEGVWLRACVEYSGCEDMPLLSGIYTNTVTLFQKHRESSFADMMFGNGIVEVDDVLAATGERMVMVRDAHGWIVVPDPEYTVSASTVKFDLSQYAKEVADDGKPNVRLVFCTYDFSNKIFYSSNGLPCQNFEFDPNGTLLSEELKIMVKDRENSDNPRWNEYSYIENLELAGAFDRVFTFDEKNRTLVFGDNENGEVPPVGNDNILISSCSVTNGFAGNAASGNLKEIRCANESYRVCQPVAAKGGRDRETFDAALRRFRYELSDCCRAVSAEDYRRLAMRTPGLRVADVKAIPSFDPDDVYASPEKLRGIMTLAVLPYSRSTYPMPDEKYLAAVRNYMEKSRLLTVELKTCGPVYVMVNINAEIVCGTNEVEMVLKNAEAQLRSMFGVYSADGASRFGKPVREADLIAELCNIQGVLTVKNLKINTDRPECKKTAAGLTIPPNAIACCGKVELVSTER